MWIDGQKRLLPTTWTTNKRVMENYPEISSRNITTVVAPSKGINLPHPMWLIYSPLKVNFAVVFGDYFLLNCTNR